MLSAFHLYYIVQLAFRYSLLILFCIAKNWCCIRCQWQIFPRVLAGVRLISSVIRQTGESENGCFKKLKHAEFSKKRTFLTPWYAHVRKTSKIHDCFQNFPLYFMSLVTIPIVKNSHILAGIYFIYLKERHRPNSKVWQYQIWTSVKRSKK